MDYMAKITELKAAKATALANAEKALGEGNLEDAKKFNDTAEGIVNSIGEYERLAKSSADNADPKDPTKDPAPKDVVRPFHSFGEQLKAIVNVSKTKIADDRLIKINDAVGAVESVGTDGGFAVQEDFATGIMASAAQTGEILRRVDHQTVSNASNSMRWYEPEENDISASVFGGVQMYWNSEATTVNAVKPRFREVKVDLEKMMGLAYCTDELLTDAPFMSGFFGRAFSLAAERLCEAAIISGNGVGKPLGILNSTGTVTVAKETNQSADTVNADNLLAIWQRMSFRQRRNAIWLAHPDCETQFPKLTLNSDNIWLPEGGFSASPYQRIFGVPIIYDDNCSALGDKGDIFLADFSDYMWLTKGTAKQDWSIHVEFLTDQRCFRMVFRCNGTPKKNTALTIKNSSKTRSSFVTLAARA